MHSTVMDQARVRWKILAQTLIETLLIHETAIKDGTLLQKSIEYAQMEINIHWYGIRWKTSSFSTLRKNAVKRFTVKVVVNVTS
jgi:hypothetical protein